MLYENPAQGILAGNQISGSKPFIFLLENNKFWSAWQLEPTNSHDLTALTSCTNWRSIAFGDILFHNKRYALDGWIIHFFPVFFIKKIKSVDLMVRDLFYLFCL